MRSNSRGTEERRLPSLQSGSICGIYFLAVGDTPEETSIDFFEFATGVRTRGVDLQKAWWYGMTLSPDGQSVLFSLVNSAGSNLMLVENFR